jgi:hypothetical protein
LPYQSKAEREAASYMTWTEILKHVEKTEQCDAKEARRQIGNAIADGVLSVRWADQRKSFGSSGPFHALTDEPSRDARYWQECTAHPNDPNLVLEPPPYDRELVDKRTAARLDKKRRFRKPMFRRDQVSLLWRQARPSATAGAEKQAIAICTEALKRDNDLRRADGLKICRQQIPRLSERGFRSRVWPRAREAAGLTPTAPKGRKPQRR